MENQQNNDTGLEQPTGQTPEVTAPVTESLPKIEVHVSDTWTGEALAAPNHEPIILPSIDPKAYDRVLAQVTEGDVKVDSPDAILNWLRVTENQHRIMPYPPRMGAAFLNVPKGRYTNRPRHQGRDLIPLRMRQPRLDPGEAKTTEAGAKAVLDLMSARGIGVRTWQFLPHSGIHLQFQPPDDPSLMELHRQMIQDSGKLGRETYGLYMSSRSVYQTEKQIDFALMHVVNSSVAESVIGKGSGEGRFGGLRNLIDFRDIPFLIQGLALAAYPRGINYQRGCSNDVAKCNHYLTANLNIQELSVFNLELFTDEQKAVWANPQTRGQTLEDLKRYRDQFPEHIRSASVTVDAGTEAEVTVEFGWASIQDYLTSGKAMVDGIVAAVEKAISENESSKAREAEYATRELAIMGVHYAYIVKAIRRGTNIEIVDRDTIVSSIRALTGDRVWYEAYIAAAMEYLDKGRVGILAVPAYKCPACGHNHANTQAGDYFREYLPLDAVTLFFDLLDARQMYLLNRTMINIDV